MPQIPYDQAIHGPLGIGAPEIPYNQWSAEDLHGALTQSADGEEAWARELLAAGADPSGMPLIMAIQCGELAIVRLFIAAGANIDRDFARTTPLIHAVNCGYPAIVEALIKAGGRCEQAKREGIAVGTGEARLASCYR